MAGDGDFTEAAGMVELNFKAYRLKSSSNKAEVGPSLKQELEWCGQQ